MAQEYTLKGQKPVVEMCAGGDPLWLFYNQDKSLIFQIPRPNVPDVVVNHMADSPTGHKCYFRAKVDLKDGHYGTISSIETLPDEEW